jgi:hypothetical protein
MTTNERKTMARRRAELTARLEANAAEQQALVVEETAIREELAACTAGLLAALDDEAKADVAEAVVR